MKKAAVIVLGLLMLASVTAFSYMNVTISSVKVLFNGKARAESSPFLTYKNQTYVPLRSIAEVLGARVDYDEVAKQASITYQEDRPLLSEVNSTASNAPFVLSIFGEKEVYKAGEAVRIWATFKNTGADTTIYGGEFLFHFYIRNLQLDGHSVSEMYGLPLNAFVLHENSEYTRNFKPYALGVHGLGEAYEPSTDFSLPKGDYAIGVRASFSRDPEAEKRVFEDVQTEIRIRVE